MIYLPTFPCEWVLSRWSGRAHSMTIDPIGVEAFVPQEPAPRGIFGRRRKEPVAPAAYLHVLVHQELSSERIRSWAVGQVAQLAALAAQPDAVGDTLNRLAASEADRLSGRDWIPADITVDGVTWAASAYVDSPGRWAAYVELGHDRVALVGRDLELADASLRTASLDEARQLRSEALRV